MCRQNMLWGCILMSFGVGLLIGIWLEGGFLAHIFSFAIICVGCGVCKRK